uniref:helix-turn-helix domain-containing protein n=1 Tax=Candidatus Stercorousia sp. TaxID=3048886 RepID=UPI004029FB61
MKDERLLQLGQKIRYERLKKGLSQEGLEEKSMVSRRTISEIERGNADIRYTNLLQIAEALNMSVSELLNFKL